MYFFIQMCFNIQSLHVFSHSKDDFSIITFLFVSIIIMNYNTNFISKFFFVKYCFFIITMVISCSQIIFGSVELLIVSFTFGHVFMWQQQGSCSAIYWNNNMPNFEANSFFCLGISSSSLLSLVSFLPNIVLLVETSDTIPIWCATFSLKNLIFWVLVNMSETSCAQPFTLINFVRFWRNYESRFLFMFFNFVRISYSWKTSLKPLLILMLMSHWFPKLDFWFLISIELDNNCLCSPWPRLI